MPEVYYNEKGKFFTDYVSKESVPAIIQTLTHRIHGTVHVRSGERVKDELDRPEPFLAVTQATVYSARGETLYSANFISINREHIVWLIPQDALENPGSSQQSEP